jgi:hypothetical protein
MHRHPSRSAVLAACVSVLAFGPSVASSSFAQTSPLHPEPAAAAAPASPVNPPGAPPAAPSLTGAPEAAPLDATDIVDTYALPLPLPEETSAAAAAATVNVEEDEDASRDRDGVRLRLRYGFSLNAGVIRSPTGAGGIVSAAGRLGLQFFHLLSLYYQNTPMLTFTPQTTHNSAGFKAGFVDYNSLLVGITVLHFVDLGLGPSWDYIAVAKCAFVFGGTLPSANCDRTNTWSPGAHARAAIILGGLVGRGPRRRGFSIGLDMHPIFLNDETLFTLTAGVGGDWY